MKPLPSSLSTGLEDDRDPPQRHPPAKMTRSHRRHVEDEQLRRLSRTEHPNVHEAAPYETSRLALDRVERRIHPFGRRNTSPPPPDTGSLEEDFTNGQPRRRVPVACARCRKRKIRCSGDPGNGAGCQNCRSAGADISLCRFARVGAMETQDLTDLSDEKRRKYHISSVPIGIMLPPAMPSYHYPTSQSVPTSFRPGYEIRAPDATFYDHAHADAYDFGPGRLSASHEDLVGYYETHLPMRQFSNTQGVKEDTVDGVKYYPEHDPSLTVGPLTQSSFVVDPTNKPSTASDNPSSFGMTALSNSLTARQERQLPPVTIDNPRTPFSNHTVCPHGRTRVLPQTTYPGSDADVRYVQQDMSWQGHAAYGSVSRLKVDEVDKHLNEETTYGRLHDQAAYDDYGPVASGQSRPPSISSLVRFGVNDAFPPVPAYHGVSALPNLPVGPAEAAVERSDSTSNLYTLSSAATSHRGSTDATATENATLANVTQYPSTESLQSSRMPSTEDLARSSLSKIDRRRSKFHAQKEKKEFQ